MGNASAKKSPTKATPNSFQRQQWKPEEKAKYLNRRIVQNISVIWLDGSINPADKQCQDDIEQLKGIVNSVTTCKDPAGCRTAIDKVAKEQIFLIVSGTLGKTFIPSIHQDSRIAYIYIYCGHPPNYEHLSESWKKVKLVANQIGQICLSMVEDVSQCEHDLTPTSIIALNNSPDQHLKQVDQSFMYSQLYKEILLQTNYDKDAMTTFCEFYKAQSELSKKQLKEIETFERDYETHTPIWWYTSESVIYKILNHALRTVDIEVIDLIAFFMKDVHRQISELHAKNAHPGEPFPVFRGQGMFNDDFVNMRNNIGGLLAFNSFLSTSRHLEQGLKFACKGADQPDKKRILFTIQVDPSITSTPFAFIDDVGRFGPTEEEVLFSMHTIFRIQSVKVNSDNIWEVQLTSVSEEEVQTTQLMKQMRLEMGEGPIVERLGRLMIKIAQYEKAEFLFEHLLESTAENEQQTIARILCQLGYIASERNKRDKAKEFYQKALGIQEKRRPTTDLDLATTYNNIALLHTKCGEYSDALDYNNRALKIQKELLKSNHIDLATTHNNIGLVHDRLKAPGKALESYKETLRIYRVVLDPNHPRIATVLNNIGIAQIDLGDRTTGLANLFQASSIRDAVLPANHPSIAAIARTIGTTYYEAGEYSMAEPFYEKALGVAQKASPPNDSELARAYDEMSRVVEKMGDYHRSVGYAELAVQTASQSSPANDRYSSGFSDRLNRLRQRTS